MAKTITGKIADRLKTVDQVHNDSLKDAKRLEAEGRKKYDIVSKQIIEYNKKLEKDPTNKKLQKDYASLLVTRDMLLSSVRLNENLIKNG